MITRRDVLSQAVDACMKELYSYVYPHVKWDDFKEECKIYSRKYKEWKNYRKLEHKNLELYNIYNEKLGWKDKSVTECIGPNPFEFYYLPKEIMKDICDSYVDVYKLDSQQELLDTIEILKNYCKEPIVDKYIKKEGEPGYRDYEHPDNLEKEIKKKLEESPIISVPPSNKEEYYTELSEKLQNKFFEFLDMAGKFYNWNRDLNTFNRSVYLGPSPNSNKEAVIENWKKYRNQDIEIDEEQIKKEYYGDEDYNE